MERYFSTVNSASSRVSTVLTHLAALPSFWLGYHDVDSSNGYTILVRVMLLQNSSNGYTILVRVS